MNIILQKASVTDSATVLEILNHGTRNKVRRGDLAWGMTDHDPEPIKQMIHSGMFYLAYLEGKPAGTVAIAWQDMHMWGNQPQVAGYIQRFAVAPGYSGQNIGGTMLDLLLQEVEKQGRQFLRIAVPSDNTKLRNYYEQRGFTRADHKVLPPIHPAYSAAYYERPAGNASPQIQTASVPKHKLFHKLKTSRVFRSGE